MTDSETVGKCFRQYGVVPAIKIDDAELAVPLAAALIEGGLPVAEITFRTAAASDAMRLMAEKFGEELMLGAGTVLNTEQADAAMEAGARFVVTPGFNPRVVDHCLAKGLPVYPGVNSPSQVEQAMERGLRVLKFFPAAVSGGCAMLKALAGPYPDTLFIPTGGINGGNLKEYLALRNVLACGGSWLTDERLLAEKDFNQITARCRAAIEQVRSLEKFRI